jgi:lactate dehydrogenase-like 2-hydroxyacid dehydrogenase
MKPELLFYGTPKPGMMDQLSLKFEITNANELIDDTAFWSGKSSEVEAIAITGHGKLTDDLMAKLPKLKIISSFGVGYDSIDAISAAKRGIVVSHTPNVLNADVSNTAIMLMLAVSRRLVVDDTYLRAGRWAKEGAAPLRESMDGRKVGIVGLGRIGLEIGRKLEAFDMEISYHTRSKKDDVAYQYYSNLVELAKNIDFMVVITPGGAETEKLINREVMNALGSDGILINIARGTVIDETEMVKALQDGRLGGAGLDVYEAEPNVPEALFELENVVLLPHVGSATIGTRQAMSDLVIKNLFSFFDTGKAIAPVPECSDL